MTWSVHDDPTIRRDGFLLLEEGADVSYATLKRAVRREGLVHALPGGYILPDRQDDLAVWLRLVHRRWPTAIVCGRAAWEAGVQQGTTLTWPRGDRAIDLGDRINRPGARPPFRFRRRRVPERFVVERSGIRRVQPVFAAAELLSVDDGAAACDFLRRTGSPPGGPGTAALASAVAALAHVPGHRDRVRLLAELRAAPWSLLELHLHRLLREAGITGWRANVPMRFGIRNYLIDVAFPDLRVAIEADGRTDHSSADAFERDRDRWNALGSQGWIVLRVTWRMVHGAPEQVIANVLAAMASRA